MKENLNQNSMSPWIKFLNEAGIWFCPLITLNQELNLCDTRRYEYQAIPHPPYTTHFMKCKNTAATLWHMEGCWYWSKGDFRVFLYQNFNTYLCITKPYSEMFLFPFMWTSWAALHLKYKNAFITTNNYRNQSYSKQFSISKNKVETYRSGTPFG